MNGKYYLNHHSEERASTGMLLAAGWRKVLLHARWSTVTYGKYHASPSEGDVWTFGRRFIRKDQWPPNSPDCNPLDFFFWDAIKREVYRDRQERFQSLDELKRRIQRVWKQSYDVETSRKAILQFRTRLQAVVTENDGPIKTHFG